MQIIADPGLRLNANKGQGVVELKVWSFQQLWQPC